MRLLLLSADLMIQSRLAGAAARAGFEGVRVVRAQDISALEGSAACGGVVLDLALPGLDLALVVPELRSRLGEAVPIVAFAPHVHTARLAAARDAGCDVVLSRGQFDREIDRIVERWV